MAALKEEIREKLMPLGFPRYKVEMALRRHNTYEAAKQFLERKPNMPLEQTQTYTPKSNTRKPAKPERLKSDPGTAAAKNQEIIDAVRARGKSTDFSSSRKLAAFMSTKLGRNRPKSTPVGDQTPVRQHKSSPNSSPSKSGGDHHRRISYISPEAFSSLKIPVSGEQDELPPPFESPRRKKADKPASSRKLPIKYSDRPKKPRVKLPATLPDLTHKKKSHRSSRASDSSSRSRAKSDATSGLGSSSDDERSSLDSDRSPGGRSGGSRGSGSSVPESPSTSKSQNGIRKKFDRKSFFRPTKQRKSGSNSDELPPLPDIDSPTLAKIQNTSIADIVDRLSAGGSIKQKLKKKRTNFNLKRFRALSHAAELRNGQDGSDSEQTERQSFSQSTSKKMYKYASTPRSVNGTPQTPYDDESVSSGKHALHTRSPTLPLDLKSQIQEFKLSEYAQGHFRICSKKRGKTFWKKKGSTSLSNILNFQSEPITESLLQLKQGNSEAVGTFRNILTFMGDDEEFKGHLPTDQNAIGQALVDSIVKLGDRKPNLRDEVYCQICKQLTNNPRKLSILRGWTLMAICISAWPCSLAFETYLTDFLQTSILNSDDEDIRFISGYCDFLMCSKFNKHIVHEQTLSLEQVQKIMKYGLPTCQVYFYSSISFIMSCQRKEGISLSVPKVLERMINLLWKLDAKNSEGIFRLAGRVSHVNQLKDTLRSGQDEEQTLIEEMPHEEKFCRKCGKKRKEAQDHLANFCDSCGYKFKQLIERMGPDVPADVLKQWMRNLSIPLIPMADYMKCIGASKKEPSEVRELVQELCIAEHWETIDYFMKFLKELISYQETTKMGITNMATVLTLNLLKTDDPSLEMLHVEPANKFVTKLITSFCEEDDKG